MKRIILLLATLAVAGTAYAQTATPQQVKVNWELPVCGFDAPITATSVCKPLTGADALTAIEVYINTVPIQDTSSMQPTVVLPAAVGGTPPLSTVQSYNAKVGDTVYIRIKARNGLDAKGLGPFSGQVFFVVKAPDKLTPGPPTNVTIQIITPDPVTP